MLPNREKTIHLVALSLLTVTAAMHYTFANCFDTFGQSLPTISNPQGLLAQAMLNYTIYYNILASLIIIGCIVSLLQMWKAFDGVFGLLSLWLFLFILNGFNFACGLICANIYDKYTKFFTTNSITISSVEYDWKVAYYTALADAVVSFVFGLPSFLALLHYLSAKRAIIFQAQVVSEWNKPQNAHILQQLSSDGWHKYNPVSL